MKFHISVAENSSILSLEAGSHIRLGAELWGFKIRYKCHGICLTTSEFLFLTWFPRFLHHLKLLHKFFRKHVLFLLYILRDIFIWYFNNLNFARCWSSLFHLYPNIFNQTCHIFCGLLKNQIVYCLNKENLKSMLESKNKRFWIGKFAKINKQMDGRMDFRIL